MQDFIGFPQGVVTAAVLYVLGHRLIGLTWLHRDTLPFQRRLFTIAFALRCATAFVLYELGFISFIGDYDGVGWLFGNALRNAWDAAGMGPVDLPSAWLTTFSTTNRGYYYLVASLLYFVGSPSRLAVAALNCAIGALTVVFAYRACRTLFSETASTRVAWWMVLFPSMIVWSAQTVKEPVAILLEVVAVYGAVAVQRWEFRPRHIFLSVVAVVAIVPFRFYAGYVAASAIVLSMIVPWSHRKQAGPASGVALAGVVVSLIIAAAILGSHDINTSSYDAEFVQRFRYNIAAGTATGVESAADMRTSSGMAFGTLFGAVHVLLAPFPWQIGSATTLMVLPELVYWWWLFFAGVLPGLRWGMRERLVDLLPLLFFTVGLLLVYSATFGNVGLAYRQRTQMLPWLFMFGAVGLEHRASAQAALERSRQALSATLTRAWSRPGRHPKPTAR